MGINASLNAKNGDSLATVVDFRGLFAWGLRLYELDSTACLKLIDPYADTVFDHAQLPRLLSELETARATITAQDLEVAKKEYFERAKTWWGPPQGEAEVRDYIDSLSLVELQRQFDRIIDLVRDAIGRGPTIHVTFIGD